MAFPDDFVGGALIVRGNKVEIRSRSSAPVQETSCHELVESASWSGGDVIVVTRAGKAHRYENNATSRYA
jgi:hypothetical protein